MLVLVSLRADESAPFPLPPTALSECEPSQEVTGSSLLLLQETVQSLFMISQDAPGSRRSLHNARQQCKPGFALGTEFAWQGSHVEKKDEGHRTRRLWTMLRMAVFQNLLTVQWVETLLAALSQMKIPRV